MKFWLSYIDTQGKKKSFNWMREQPASNRVSQTVTHFTNQSLDLSETALTEEYVCN